MLPGRTAGDLIAAPGGVPNVSRVTRTFMLLPASAGERLDRATASPLTFITAAVTVAVAALTYSGVLDAPVVGLMPVGSMIAFGAACALSWHRTADRRLPAVWAALAFGFASAVFVSRLVQVPEVPDLFAVGMLLTVIEEELVFRLAATLALWPLLRRAGLGHRSAGAVVAVIPGLVFCFMPGHVAQMASPAAAVPFLVLGLLHWWLTFSAGRLSLAVLLHLAANSMYSPLQYQMIVDVGWSRVIVVVTGAAVLAYVGARGLTRQCCERPTGATPTL